MELNEIQKEYLFPPSYKMVFSFIEELGVSMAHFENFYQIPKGTIRKVKCGYMQLPQKYWWIFYERPLPKDGTSKTFKKKYTYKNIAPYNVPENTHKTGESTTKSGHGRIKTIK